MSQLSTNQLGEVSLRPEGRLTNATHDEQVIALWLADKSPATAEIYKV